PGFDFVAGFQPFIAEDDKSNDWLNQSAEKGWITTNPAQNKLVEQSQSRTISGRLTLEPFQDFRIEVDARRTLGQNSGVYFKDRSGNQFDEEGNILDPNRDRPIGEIEHAAYREMGSFTTSYFAMNTLFNDDITGLFAEFEDNRVIISQRLGAEWGITEPHKEDVDAVSDTFFKTNKVTGEVTTLSYGPPVLGGYVNGLGRTQQDVLIPAFLAAYTGQDVNKVKIGENYAKNILFKTLPKLNWKLNYTGLGKIEALKEIFSSVAITHGYKSTLTVNSFQTNQEFNTDQALSRRNDQGNFYSRFEIPAMTINEAFSPLIGVNMKLKNDMSFTFDYKKARNLAMSINIDYQLAETKTSEFVFGFGYSMKNVIIDFLLPKNARPKRKKRGRRGKKSSKGKTPAKDKNGKEIKGNDMNFTFDFSYRDDVTINHRLDQGIAEPTRGSKTLTISPSIDYDINKQLNVRLFFDHRRVIPATSASFPITTNQGGITIRFSLN
ncbi:MAG: cell surface protein SprA, partial [Flavobacteriales bacterium]